MKQWFIVILVVFGLAGAFVSAARAEQVIYRYDDMQRLTRAEYTSGLILAYTYDKAGNRLNQQVRSGVMLTVNVTGSGTVTSDPTGIECRENCSEVFALGTEVTLQAEPDEGGEFLGWSGGGCSGSDPCVLTLEEYTLVDAEFVSVTTPTPTPGPTATPTPEPTATPTPVSGLIIDNEDDGFSTVGTWSFSTLVPGYYGSNYQWSSSGDGSAQAIWTFVIPEEGDYRVSAWWSSPYETRASNAPYLITHAAGSTRVEVDQRSQGSQWNSLGIYHFLAGSTTVVLTNEADGNPVADAVRLEPVSSTPTPTPTGTPSATLVVTNTNDSGSGSLRQAIVDASDGAEITFHPTLITYPATIALSSQLTIDKPLTITGPGAGQLSLSGNDAVRVFSVSGNDTVATISDLTIQDGYTGNASGGGIWNDGHTLTLIRCQVRDNTSTVDNLEQGGGGLGNISGTVVIEDCSFSGNTAVRGGGIYTIDGTLTISGSTITQNTSSAYGGGLYHRTGTTSLTNSTISGNSTGGEGGGIFAIYDQVELTYCTVTQNTANRGGGTSNWSGESTVESLRISGTLIAENTGMNPDCSGTVVSFGYNLLETPTGCILHGTTTGNITGSDPQIGDLADNGGATVTHELLSGSPAIDAIPNGTNGCGTTITTDQRGYVRPETTDGTCDIGAYEQAEELLLLLREVYDVSDSKPLEYDAFQSDDQEMPSHDTPTPVPEPSLVLLFGVGLLGLIALIRRRVKK